MRTLGILAHVDAGKTTLSERMLYLAGAIRSCGEVEEGLATLDFLPEEQERGITIETGVERLTWRGGAIQLLDTPGHVDFGSEVGGALHALDGAVLVVSGTRHLQTQTLSAWNKLREAGVPTIVFVNRLDVPGSDLDETLLRLRGELGRKPLLMTLPLYSGENLEGVVDVLNRVALRNDPRDPRAFVSGEIPPELKARADELHEELVLRAGEADEELAEAWLSRGEADVARVVKALRERLRAGDVLPVWCGAAKRCVGVRQLLNGVSWFVDEGRSLRSDAALRVVRARWTPSFGRWYMAQAMRALDRSELEGMRSLRASALEETASVEAGEVFALRAPDARYRPGDLIELSGGVVARESARWEEPLLEVRLEAKNDQSAAEMAAALEELRSTDPSLRVRSDPDGLGWVVAGVGEVHLDVAVERLRRDFGLRFRVGNPAVQHRERWCRPQRDLSMECEVGDFRADCRLSLLPWEGEGVSVVMETETANSGLPKAVFDAAVEEWARRGVLGQGFLSHLRVLVHEIHFTEPFLPGVFKKMVDDLLRLRSNGQSVRVEEPVVRLEIWTPSEHHGAVLGDLMARGGKVVSEDCDGYHWRLEARMPMGGLIGYAVALRSVTRGTATFTPLEEGWDDGIGGAV